MYICVCIYIYICIRTYVHPPEACSAVARLGGNSKSEGSAVQRHAGLRIWQVLFMVSFLHDLYL